MLDKQAGYVLQRFPVTLSSHLADKTHSKDRVSNFPLDAGYAERAETKNEADEDMQWDHRESGKYTKKARAAMADISISSTPLCEHVSACISQEKSSRLRS
jgi:hypothetical protein